MTTSTTETQTDPSVGLSKRPRGTERTAAAADDHLSAAKPAEEAPLETEDRADNDQVTSEPAATVPAEQADEPGQPAPEAEIPGTEAAAAARAAADAAAADLGLSGKSAELLHSLLVLSATDLSRGYPWRVHNMSARDWYEGFLFDDTASWLMGVGDAFSMRAFRTAMSGAEALAAFNSLSVLCLTPGVRESVNAGVQTLLADPPRITRIMSAAKI